MQIVSQRKRFLQFNVVCVFVYERVCACVSVWACVPVCNCICDRCLGLSVTRIHSHCLLICSREFSRTVLVTSSVCELQIWKPTWTCFSFFFLLKCNPVSSIRICCLHTIASPRYIRSRDAIYKATTNFSISPEYLYLILRQPDRPPRWIEGEMIADVGNELHKK